MIREIIREIFSEEFLEEVLIINEMPTLELKSSIGNVTIDFFASDKQGDEEHPNEPLFHLYKNFNWGR